MTSSPTQDFVVREEKVQYALSVHNNQYRGSFINHNPTG